MRSLRLMPLLLACGFATGAAAQYPDKPIRLIVPQAAGSATDTVARILGAELAKGLGQQIVIDNRPGGALTLGLDLTAKADADGYTICMGPIGALAINRHMVAKLPYDIERDLQPIALVTRGHLLLAVSPTLSFTSVQEIIDYAKQNPGKLLNASSSNGSPGHVGGELFKYMSGDRYRARSVSGRRGGDQRPDRRPRASDVREPELDRAARQVRHGAADRGSGRAALARFSGLADGRGGRRPRLRGADLERRHRAGRRAAADHRQAQCGHQPRRSARRSSGTASLRSATSRLAARPRNSPR